MESDEQHRKDYGITEAEIGIVMDDIYVLEARWQQIRGKLAENRRRIERVNRHDPAGLERALSALPDPKSTWVVEHFGYDHQSGRLSDTENLDSPYVMVDMNLETGILSGRAQFFVPAGKPIPEGESREDRLVIKAIGGYNAQRRIEYESAQKRKARLRQAGYGAESAAQLKN